MMPNYHIPVMVEEILGFFETSPMKVFVDCTLGDGGHTDEILKHFTEVFGIGIDVDDEALTRARERLFPSHGGRVLITKGDYRELPKVMGNLGVPRMDGMLLDLGISSLQIDSLERGFTYREGAPLDMRMDRDRKITARDILCTYSKEDLERILREYGEERFSRRIAEEIVKHRDLGGDFRTADDLVGIILRAGRFSKRSRAHPARRTFQALRIEANDELGRLGRSIEKAFNLLKPKGVMAVITYHSLEDRIVKGTMRSIEDGGSGRRVNRKVVTPQLAETEGNPRARSAKLRVLEKLT